MSRTEKSMMDQEKNVNVEARLGRIAGQVSGIQRMVDTDRYCVDVLMQIAAVRAALGKVSKILLESHIQTCVVGAFGTDDQNERAAKIEELVKIFEKNVGR